jgi:DNA-binding transcriptional LysR family regulator
MQGEPMSTLSQWKTFVTVVDERGFTAAGRRLGLSQPAVSRAVASLEKELGLPLLVRGPDGLAVTEAGELALAHAREAVRHLASLRTEIAALAGEVTGTLSLASLPSVTGTVIAPHLRSFTERHPGVTIRLLEGSETEVRDWLDQGAAEAGVVSLPITGLDVAALSDQDFVAVVPAHSRLAGWAQVDYAELAKEPFIRSTGGCAEIYTPAARRAGVELDVAFEAREMSSVLEIVRAGLGVSILPHTGLPDVGSGVVVVALVPKTVRRLGIAVSASASAPARAFLEQIAAHDVAVV